MSDTPEQAEDPAVRAAEITKFFTDEKIGRGQEVQSAWDLVQDGQARISDEHEANLVGKLLIEAEAEIERVQAMADARVARAKARAKKYRWIFERALADWTMKRLGGGKTRSILLDDVQLGLRKTPPKTETENELMLQHWAETEYLDAVTYVPKVSMAMVKEWEKQNKTLAPGRRSTDPGEVFYFRVAQPKEDANGDASSGEAHGE